MRGASLAIVAPGRRVLVLQRSERAGGYPAWNLPGGGREAGEGTLQCALHEAWEEAGFRLQDDDLVVGAIPQRSGYITWVVRIRRTFRPRLNWESSSAGWMSLDDESGSERLIRPQRPVFAEIGRMVP